MDPGVGTISAVSSALTVTIRISQTIYELKAVDQQARDLLDTTAHVDSCLGNVRILRRQKSTHLSSTEKKWIDEVMTNTEKTVENVAALIEPARVDLKTRFGKVGFKNKVAFVLRDSPRVGTHLARLAIVSQSLNTVLGIVCSREGIRQVVESSRSTLGGWGDNSAGGNMGGNGAADSRPPPAYEEIMRRRDEKRRTLTSPVIRKPTPTNGAVTSQSLPSPTRIQESIPEAMNERRRSVTSSVTRKATPANHAVTSQSLPSPNGIQEPTSEAVNGRRRSVTSPVTRKPISTNDAVASQNLPSPNGIRESISEAVTSAPTDQSSQTIRSQPVPTGIFNDIVSTSTMNQRIPTCTAGQQALISLSTVNQSALMSTTNRSSLISTANSQHSVSATDQYIPTSIVNQYIPASAINQSIPTSTIIPGSTTNQSLISQPPVDQPILRGQAASTNTIGQFASASTTSRPSSTSTAFQPASAIVSIGSSIAPQQSPSNLAYDDGLIVVETGRCSFGDSRIPEPGRPSMDGTDRLQVIPSRDDLEGLQVVPSMPDSAGLQVVASSDLPPEVCHNWDTANMNPTVSFRNSVPWQPVQSQLHLELRRSAQDSIDHPSRNSDLPPSLRPGSGWLTYTDPSPRISASHMTIKPELTLHYDSSTTSLQTIDTITSETSGSGHNVLFHPQSRISIQAPPQTEVLPRAQSQMVANGGNIASLVNTTTGSRGDASSRRMRGRDRREAWLAYQASRS